MNCEREALPLGYLVSQVLEESALMPAVCWTIDDEEAGFAIFVEGLEVMILFEREWEALKL